MNLASYRNLNISTDSADEPKNKTSGLIIPSDSVPKVASLKRHFLFFDSLSIVDPRDKALVNLGELTEKFPNMEIQWADYAPFPRSDNYNEEYSHILGETQTLQRRGLLKILPPFAINSDDAGANFMLYNSAISDPELIKRAIPDFTPSCNPTVNMPNGMITGGGMAQSGFRSKYELNVKPACKLEGVDSEWNTLGYLRTGRTLKAMRRSYKEGAFPLAFDNVSQNILAALSENFKPASNRKDSLHLEGLTNLSISLDVVDPIELENILDDMSWNDVLLLRREILPQVVSFRDYVLKRVKLVSGRDQKNAELIQKEIISLKIDLDNKREILADQWEKLRIGSIVKLGGAVGGGSFGLSLIRETVSFEALLLNVVSLSLVGAATLTTEIEDLIVARNKVKKHPLLFIDSLPR